MKITSRDYRNWCAYLLSLVHLCSMCFSSMCTQQSHLWDKNHRCITETFLQSYHHSPAITKYICGRSVKGGLHVQPQSFCTLNNPDHMNKYFLCKKFRSLSEKLSFFASPQKYVPQTQTNFAWKFNLRCILIYYILFNQISMESMWTCCIIVLRTAIFLCEWFKLIIPRTFQCIF